MSTLFFHLVTQILNLWLKMEEFYTKFSFYCTIANNNFCFIYFSQTTKKKKAYNSFLGPMGLRVKPANQWICQSMIEEIKKVELTVLVELSAEPWNLNLPRKKQYNQVDHSDRPGINQRLNCYSNLIHRRNSFQK